MYEVTSDKDSQVFETDIMYCAIDVKTNKILLGGGTDELLPYVNCNGRIAPKQIKHPKTGEMHEVCWKLCYIKVEVAND